MYVTGLNLLASDYTNCDWISGYKQDNETTS